MRRPPTCAWNRWARDKLRMRTATPAVTHYVGDELAAPARGASRAMSAKATPRAAATSVRNLNYATSPLLASKTPPWRSRLLVALVGLAFAVLVGRAVYIQIIGTDFLPAAGRQAATAT